MAEALSFLEGKASLGLGEALTARALLLGERLDTRGFETQELLARAPLLARVDEGGLVVLFRYGVAVLFDVTPAAEKALTERLLPFTTDPFKFPETEDVPIAVQPDAEDLVDLNGTVSLRELSVERLQLVADALAKTLLLAHYETSIASAFDRVDPLAEKLRRSGKVGGEGRALVRQIGQVLSVQHKMVGRVGTDEKPDLLWDHPELERLYARLAEEYELRERSRALDRKLDVISRTTETLLGLVQQRGTMRVEWYIVALIVAELALGIFDLAIK